MRNNIKKTSYFKRAAKKTISFVLSICIIFSLSIGALAATYTIYSNIKTDWVTSIPTKTADELSCSGVGGIAVAKKKNSMFTVKNATGSDTVSKFYYYPDIDNIESSTTKIFTLYDAGHANAMAIDGTYVYITCWRNTDNSSQYKNKIMLLPRSLIASTANNTTLPKKTSTKDGYKIVTAKVANTDPATKATKPYVDYTKAIASITLFKSNGRFIIGYDIPGKSDQNYSFTTAKLITYNGEEIFLVSENPDDMFVIKNNLKYKYGTGQDICYSTGNGFFKAIWYYDSKKLTSEYANASYANKNKSIILWADIDSEAAETITYDDVSYRLYTPDVINIDKSDSKYDGATKFKKFEIESLAFTQDGEMLAAFNIAYTENYINKYKANNNGSKPPADSIYKITHDSGQKFVLS